MQENVIALIKELENKTLKIKEATLSGTADVYGNVYLGNHLKIICAVLDQSYINFPFMYSGYANYIRVMLPDGTGVGGATVTGKYYYLDT